MPKRRAATLNNETDATSEDEGRGSGRRRRVPMSGLANLESRTLELATGVHRLSDDVISSCRRKLLQWYDSHQRVLPWRTLAKDEVDPVTRAYGVWVSEVMLQQTQVATVIAYYNKWMKKWPTVYDLAEAPLEEVHQQWSGLGYYARGRRLHEGAAKIVKELNGAIPVTAVELSNVLPGVGRYTAAAIASIAFGQKVGVLDGNVMRILCRHRRIGAEVNDAKTAAVLWSLADALVDEKRPGDFNQAMMDLGATVCTPKSPKCHHCPLRDTCLAHLQETTHAGRKLLNAREAEATKAARDIEECAAGCTLCCPDSAPWDPSKGVTYYPRKAQKKAARVSQACVCVIQSCGKLLVVRRPSGGLLGGLWEFPSTPLVSDGLTESDVTKTAVNLLCDEFALPGVTASDVHYAGDVLHKFSHINQTYRVCAVTISTPISPRPPKNCTVDWVEVAAASSLAMSVAMRKVLAAVKQRDSSHVEAVVTEMRPSSGRCLGTKKKSSEQAAVGRKTDIRRFFKGSDL